MPSGSAYLRNGIPGTPLAYSFEFYIYRSHSEKGMRWDVPDHPRRRSGSLPKISAASIPSGPQYWRFLSSTKPCCKVDGNFRIDSSHASSGIALVFRNMRSRRFSSLRFFGGGADCFRENHRLYGETYVLTQTVLHSMLRKFATTLCPNPRKG